LRLGLWGDEREVLIEDAEGKRWREFPNFNIHRRRGGKEGSTLRELGRKRNFSCIREKGLLAMGVGRLTKGELTSWFVRKKDNKRGKEKRKTVHETKAK